MDEDKMVVLSCFGQLTPPQMVDNVSGLGEEISIVGGNKVG